MVKYIKPAYCRCPLPLEQVKAAPSLSPFKDEHETTGNNYFCSV